MPPPSLLQPAASAARAVVPLAQAPALPRLHGGQVRLCTRLAGGTWPLGLDDGSTHTLACVAGEPPGWREAVVLRVGALGHEAELALDAGALDMLLAGQAGTDAPLAWRQMLVADRLHGPLRRLLGQAPAWEAATAPWPRDDANALWLAVRGPGGAGAARPAGHARWRWAGAAAWAAVADTLLRQPLPAPPAAGVCAMLASLPIAMRLELGRTRLGVAALREIRRGDIVAVDSWRPRGQALGVQLYAGRRGRVQWPAEVRQDRLTVLSPLERPMTALATPPTPAPPVPAAPPSIALSGPGDDTLPAATLAELEVTLHFDLGGLSLSLAELAAITAGQVLTLPQPLNQCELSIVCQDRVLGRGQLVAVGDRLGVRVTAFAAGGDAAPA